MTPRTAAGVHPGPDVGGSGPAGALEDASLSEGLLIPGEQGLGLLDPDQDPSAPMERAQESSQLRFLPKSYCACGFRVGDVGAWGGGCVCVCGG